MSPRGDQLLLGFRDLVAATSERDCIRRIEAQAQQLFPPARVRVLGYGDAPRRTARTLPLQARGRTLGHLEFLDARVELPPSISTFAENAALALDNARLLDEHEHLARRDPLTGLGNNREFREVLSVATAAAVVDPAARTGLVILDLDRFKEVNDRGGHAAGDRLLRSVAGSLATVCRSRDQAFRIGGDEFALVLRGVDGACAARVAARAAQAIRRLDGSNGASWGVATVPDDAVSDDGLIAAADGAMYRQKGRPAASRTADTDPARRRLAVASGLATRLTVLGDVRSVAAEVVDELHRAFGYYLAVVHRLGDDDTLRVVAGAGPLATSDADFLAWEQPLSRGINGRVARTGLPALVHDTRADPEYLGRDSLDDPGAELCVPIHVGDRVWGVLNLEQMATHAFDRDDVLLAQAVGAQIGAAVHRCELLDELHGTFATTLGILSEALEMRDRYTASHSGDVAELARGVALSLALEERRVHALLHCARLHDIGKLGVRTELLAKPGPLSSAERREMQAHSTIGSEMLSRFPLLAGLAPLVRAVHERWDGTGYPDRLAGTEIPLEARIVAVCDAWHAMTSDRPYRPALAAAAARAELLAGAGTQFDADVVRALLEILGEGDLGFEAAEARRCLL